MRTAVVLALAALLAAPGCGGLSQNHKQGLAAVGGLAMIVGTTVMVDGWSCDSVNHAMSPCTHDSAELRNGAITFGLGAALFGWAIYALSHDDAAAASPATGAPARDRAAAGAARAGEPAGSDARSAPRR